MGRFLAQGRLVLADDMGLGKTTQAIGCRHALYDAGRVERGLLVVAARAQAAVAARVARDPTRRSGSSTATPASGARSTPTTRRGFLVTNYEQLIATSTPSARWSPELVVLDEAQRIKNWATKTALREAPRRPRTAWCSPGRRWRTGSTSWRRSSSGSTTGARAQVAPRALAHARTATAGAKCRGAEPRHAARRAWPAACCAGRAQGGARQLPPRTDTRVPVEMTEQQRDAHDELNQPIAQLRAHRAAAAADARRSSCA